MNTSFSLRNLSDKNGPDPLCILRNRGWDQYAGLSHGFTTRRGGFSIGPYHSLNLGRSTLDDPRTVEKNWARLCALAGIPQVNWVSAQQVHSDRLLWTTALEERNEIHREPKTADAVATDLRGIAVHVRTADCVPILLISRKARLAAAVHAGWRGTVGNIAGQSAAAMRERYPQADDIEALIGPSIGPCCFVVDSSVSSQFDSRFVLGQDPIRVNLWQANAAQLERAGIDGSKIAAAGVCTVCNPDLFFSHRRDRGTTGRMIAWAAWQD